MTNSKQRRADRRKAAQASGDGLQNVMAGLGTGRDKMSYSEYGVVTQLDRMQLEGMYRASWIAKKIVNIPSEDMTRAWRQCMFDDESVGDPKESNTFTYEQAERQFQIQAKVRQALMWSRLYGGAVLLLGVGDPKDYDKPLDVAKVKKGDLRHIMAMDRWLCLPSGQFDYSDIESPNFGMPEFYTVAQAKNVRIHHSRVIRFIGDELPWYPSIQNLRWGDPVLQVVYDTLRGRDTITAAIATMMFEANVDVMKVAGLGDMLGTDGGEAKLTKRFQLAAMMKSFNRMLLMDEGETFEKKSNSFSGLDSIIREFRAEVAGAADIPVSRLFGTSANGLNATGDNEVRNYYDMISSKQQSNLRPQLERLDEVLLRHTFGSLPDDFRFEFNPLWQLSDKERADTEKVRADRDKIYYDMGVLSEGVIARELKESGTYATMTEDDVELAEELAEMAQEARENGMENALNGGGEDDPDGKADPDADANGGGEPGEADPPKDQAD